MAGDRPATDDGPRQWLHGWVLWLGLAFGLRGEPASNDFIWCDCIEQNPYPIISPALNSCYRPNQGRSLRTRALCSQSSRTTHPHLLFSLSHILAAKRSTRTIPHTLPTSTTPHAPTVSCPSSHTPCPYLPPPSILDPTPQPSLPFPLSHPAVNSSSLHHILHSRLRQCTRQPKRRPMHGGAASHIRPSPLPHPPHSTSPPPAPTSPCPSTSPPSQA